MAQIKEYTQDMYKKDMEKLLEEKGLCGAITHICDKINSIASILDYTNHRDIQELMCDIMYLTQLYEERTGKKWENHK